MIDDGFDETATIKEAVIYVNSMAGKISPVCWSLVWLYLVIWSFCGQKSAGLSLETLQNLFEGCFYLEDLCIKAWIINPLPADISASMIQSLPKMISWIWGQRKWCNLNSTQILEHSCVPWYEPVCLSRWKMGALILDCYVSSRVIFLRTSCCQNEKLLKY